MALGALTDAIAYEESGGNYRALGKPTASGDRAYGKYQVMGSNIPQWTKEALGIPLTPQQFLQSPQAQEVVARTKLGQYLSTTGNPADAASMWFTGKPAAQGATLKDANGVTGAQYVANVTRNMGGGSAATLNAVPEQDILGEALNPVEAGAVANAAAGLAPRAPPALTPAPTVLNQVPEQDILGQALASTPAASAPVQSAPPMAGPPLSNPNMTAFRENLAASESGGGIFSAPGGGLDVMNALPIVGPSILKAGAGINALVSPYIGGGAPGPSDDFSDRYSNEVAQQNQQMREYQAQHPEATMAANMAGGVLGAAPLVAAAPAAFGINSAAGLATNALAGAGTGAVLSGADAAARGGSPRAIGTSAAIGGVAGAAAPLLGGAMNALGRGLTGGAMATDDASLAALARDKYGIQLTNDQLAGAPGGGFLRSASDRLPFSGAGSDIANTQAGFNRAVASTIGENATKLTPQVMGAAKTRIGSMFDSVAANTSIKADAQFDNDLLGVVSQAQDSGMTADELRPINKIFDSILDAVDPNTRTLSGSAYQTLTRSNTPFGRALSNPNPNISSVAGDIKDALDDALGRSASPADLQTFQDAKGQWRNLRTIEGNVAQNGGNVSAPRLASDLNNSRFSKNTMAYGGGGDLGELASIGQRFMKQPPSSGTAERLAALGALGTVASGGNALLQGSLAGAAPGLGIVPAVLGANRFAVNPLLRSQWLANSLINRSLPGAAGAATPSWLAAGALGAATTGSNALLSGGQ